VTRRRLDDELVRRGLYASRSRARDAILRGTVAVNGAPAAKPAQLVGEQAAIDLHDAAHAYVSRAALKLRHALTAFEINVQDRRALDIGASTGGFTQVLLEQGAAHVTSIDVGHGQIAPQLAADPRVTSLEGLNARDLDAVHLAGPIDLIVCDVSFISLKLALPKALSLVEPGARLVALIKPQFEVGREALGKGGLVTGPAEHDRVCREVTEFLVASGWQTTGLIPSPIAGGDGNKEFLVAATSSSPARGRRQGPAAKRWER
jgi:23S rRNA (cytidine1920-2'-O)/16S rRNA (cytidine1409-2'-O)-methyltransferase